MEEVARLKIDMRNCVHHYVSEYEYLSTARSKLEALEDVDRYTQGSISLLINSITVCEQHLKELNAFVQFIELPHVVENLSDNASTEHGIPDIVPEKELSVRCVEYDYDKQDSDL